MIVAGSQQALELCATVLLDPGDAAWIEDPGYPGARGALLGGGARLIPVPVDEEGIDVAAGTLSCPEARLAYVSPSHQYPLGVVMSLPRRLALLKWAESAGAWVVEDDYDSEFRYRGRPLSALQGLDTHGRVIYVGTFSKVLFPSLRLGYLVVPARPGRGLRRRERARRAPGSDVQPVRAGGLHRRRALRAPHPSHARALRRASDCPLERGRVGSCGACSTSAHRGRHARGRVATPTVRGRSARLPRSGGARGDRARRCPSTAWYTAARGGLLLGYTGIEVREIRQGVRALRTAISDLAPGNGAS